MNTSSLHVRVDRKAREAHDICTFKLVAADGQVLPRFDAGSHIDVHLPNGLTRQYSLCNDPAQAEHYLIGVLRERASRGGSAALHDCVQEGDLLEISPPRNHFPLAKHAQRSLLLAGGIGVTPVLCMAEHLAATRQEFALHYCTRSPERTAFRARIERAPFADRVWFHFDDGAPQQRLDLEVLLANPQPGTHLYVCGPTGFMDWVLAQAQASGWPGVQVHHEYFAAPAMSQDSDAPFELQLSRSGRVIAVPSGMTALKALADAGVELAASCEQGVCGTCVTGVLEGVPDHRDQVLSASERAANDRFLPCCSRAKSQRLVLDL